MCQQNVKQKLASSTSMVYKNFTVMHRNVGKHRPYFMVERKSNNQIYDIISHDNSNP